MSLLLVALAGGGSHPGWHHTAGGHTASDKEGGIDYYILEVMLRFRCTYCRTVLIAWFNDCILEKSGQIANPIIAKVDPVP